MRTTLIAGLLAFLAAGPAAVQLPKYRVTTTVDKHTDFSRLKTYVWEHGWTSYDAVTHEKILVAVDRELASLGFTKGAEGRTDVTVVYAMVPRADVDLKSKTRGPQGERPTFPVATLVVLIHDPDTRKELFRARIDTPVALESEEIEATINSAVAQMFARYPTRR